MGAQRRLTSYEVETMRRSWAMSHQVTEADAQALFTELTALLTEQAELRRTLARLGAPWADVRNVLNELHALIGPAPTLPHRSD